MEYQWRVILKAWPGGIAILEGLVWWRQAGEEGHRYPARGTFILMGKGNPEQLDSHVCPQVCENNVCLMVKRESSVLLL